MAHLMKNPNTEKLQCENVEVNGMNIGHASMQGYRVSMEDEHIIETFESLPDHTLVAIMDGHAGKLAAEFTSVLLRQKIEECDDWHKYCQFSEEKRKSQTDLLSRVLVQAYVAVDEDLRMMDESGLMDESGCTCVSAIITPTHVVCANVGDSRAVVGLSPALFPDSQCKALTEDHKPQDPEERKRIEKAGGHVMFNRVNGELAMSRALGDFRYKNNPALSESEHLVISYPDVSIHQRSGNNDEIMILACDGVWDVMSNEDSIDYLREVVFCTEASSSPDLEIDDIDSDGEEDGVDTDTDESEDSNEQDIITPKVTTAGKNSSKVAGKKRKRNGLLLKMARVPPPSVSSQEAAESLIDMCLSDGSTDNISAIVVQGL